MPALRAQFTRHRGAFEQLLAHWEKTPLRRGGVGFLTFDYRRQILTESIRLARLCEGDAAAARAAADDLLRTQRLTSLARELEVEEATLDAVRAAFVGPRSGVLMLLIEPRGSFLVALGPNGEALIELPPAAELQSNVRSLQGALDVLPLEADRQGAGERARAYASKLSAAFLRPELVRLLEPWDAVTVTDYGLLGGLPWECLVLEDGRLLGERVAVNTLTSLPLGIKLLRTRHQMVPRNRASATLVATLQRDKSLAPGAASSAASRPGEEARPGGQPPRPPPMNPPALPLAIGSRYRGCRSAASSSRRTQTLRKRTASPWSCSRSGACGGCGA